jgi:uncharacterized membrane protein YkvA (DUF1232 family)
MTEHDDPAEDANPEHDITPEPALPANGTGLPFGKDAQPDEPAGKKQMSPELAQFWQAVKRLPTYAKLATAILRDPDVPKSAKVVLGVGGGYALSPIDLIPGIIPVVGQMDDVYAVLTALQQSLKRMPDDLANKHLETAGVSRDLIDGDLAAVRAVAKFAVVRSVKFGGKALGRISRATINFANDQLERRDARRRETTG